MYEARRKKQSGVLGFVFPDRAGAAVGWRKKKRLSLVKW